MPRGSVFLIVIPVGAILFAATLIAAVPSTMSYQGKLTTAAGTSVADGAYTLRYALYDAPAGGAALWAETLTVAVTNGLFSIQLGTEHPLTASLFSGADRWIGVGIGADAESTPRTKLTAVAYAFAIDGSSGAYLQLSGGTMTGPITNTGDPAITMGKGNFGQSNTNAGIQAFVSGGGNTASGDFSASNGKYNNANGHFSVVGGGLLNSANGAFAAISSGKNNQAGLTSSDSAAVVAGGSSNQAASAYSAVGGGTMNQAAGKYSTVAGGFQNYADLGGAVVGGYKDTALGGYAFIGGGVGNIAFGDFSSLGGGKFNRTDGPASHVAGGLSNLATGMYAAVGGGAHNYARGDYSVIAGGGWDGADSNSAPGKLSCIGGGAGNRSAGDYSIVPGGFNCWALGNFSFAAGTTAKANHLGTFVWADNSGGDFASERNNQMRARAIGGARFDVNNARWVNLFDDGANLVSTSTGARLTTGGVWTNSSDRNNKINFAPVDGQQILVKISALPVTQWRYKADSADIRHIGPTAQDFYAAFGLGGDTTTISTIDPSGVALVAIKELIKQNAELKSEIAELKKLVHSQPGGAHPAKN